MSKFRSIKHIVRSTIILALVCYFGIIAVLSIPFIQKRLSDFTAQELSRIMQTEVRIGNIDLGLLNRVIIQNVYLEDKSGKELLKINRLSAKMELSSLLHGKIRISSVQLFGLNAHLNRPTLTVRQISSLYLMHLPQKIQSRKNQPSICVLIPY